VVECCGLAAAALVSCVKRHRSAPATLAVATTAAGRDAPDHHGDAPRNDRQLCEPCADLLE
jgi:hypothetical protein